MTEHEYLRSLIEERFNDRLNATYSLRKKREAVALRGDYLELNLINGKIEFLWRFAFQERSRAEDILLWLEMDSALRGDAKNYPDEYEYSTRFKFHDFN